MRTKALRRSQPFPVIAVAALLARWATRTSRHRQPRTTDSRTALVPHAPSDHLSGRDRSPTCFPFGGSSVSGRHDPIRRGFRRGRGDRGGVAARSLGDGGALHLRRQLVPPRSLRALFDWPSWIERLPVFGAFGNPYLAAPAGRPRCAGHPWLPRRHCGGCDRHAHAEDGLIAELAFSHALTQGRDGRNQVLAGGTKVSHQ